MTLTLNDVHIGPDNAYIADKNGNVCDLTQIQTESGVFACSLYAKNTVSNLVINGYNTFEVPQVSRRLAKGGPEGHYGTRELGEKLERQELGLDPTEESYTDVTIDIQGFTDDKDYSDTTGDFAKGAEDTDTQLTEKEGDVPEYLTLSTADNSGDASVAGTPTTGTVFFMPSGIKEEYKKADGITKWSQIGTITIGIETEQPTA